MSGYTFCVAHIHATDIPTQGWKQNEWVYLFRRQYQLNIYTHCVWETERVGVPFVVASIRGGRNQNECVYILCRT